MTKATGETPLGALLKGGVAGAIGTLAMDLVWYSRHRRSGGEDSFAEWELSGGTVDYEEAAAPAKVGKRLVEGLFETELDPSTAGPMTNAVHWATGIGWGAFHGILAGSMTRSSSVIGLVTGATAWGTSYGMLAAMGFYRPIWRYDAKTLWKDLSAHLVFGMATGLAFSILTKGD